MAAATPHPHCWREVVSVAGYMVAEPGAGESTKMVVAAAAAAVAAAAVAAVVAAAARGEEG